MDSNPRLNPAIQGLEILVDIDDLPVRAIIPRVVLENVLHCDVGPSGWTQTYRVHAAAIDAVVRRRFASKPQDFVVLRSSDFGADA
jgi:hypothetical protein